MELPMMLAQAVALSLAGEADARLKYRVTARQRHCRHHPTTKEQNDQCQTLKRESMFEYNVKRQHFGEPQVGFTRSVR